MPHTGWSNFFILTGGAAATLMGLLFVAATIGGTGFSTLGIGYGSAAAGRNGEFVSEPARPPLQQWTDVFATPRDSLCELGSCPTQAPPEPLVVRLTVLEYSVQEQILSTCNRSPRNFVDGCVEGAEHLKKYVSKGQSLRFIELRSPSRRVARIEGNNEL